MFKNLKTSTQISLRFTIFSAIILLVVAFIMNVFFFYSWYFNVPVFSNENGIIWPLEIWNFGKRWDIWEKNLWKTRDKNWFSWEIWEMPLPPFQERWLSWDFNRFSPEKNFPRRDIRFQLSSDEAKDILSQKHFLHLIQRDGYFLYVDQVEDSVLVRNVTTQVESQIILLLISLFVLIWGTLLSYIISLFFVKSALKKLNTLNDALEGLDIDHLDKKIDVEWAEDDEINKVINKFNLAIEKINLQALWLKDFVRNASHELRTPLMWMSTLIDFARKSKDYDSSIIEIKWEIKRMDSLLDTLLLITKLEEKVQLEKENIDIIPKLNSLIDQIQWEYSDKNVKLKVSLPSHLEKEVHVQWLESIFSNLIRNAFKYVNDGWEIKISLKENEFGIWNSWEGIKKDNLDKIWERFWQWDTSHTDAKSFWLWLYLSKLFAEKQGFDLRCDSKEWKWVTFTLKFN